VIIGKLGSRILTIILAVVLGIFLLMSFFVISGIRTMEETARIHTEEITSISENDSVRVIEDIGKNAIRQKAEDVARQAEIYIKSRPGMGVKDLQNDPEFQAIAVQPVGKTGYTAMTDYKTLTCRFHKDPKTVNLDLSTLAGKLPGFWSIMSRTRGGFPAEGFYDWQDPDGTIRSKYMYIAVINATTADGVGMHVAATTYVDEFSAPVTQFGEKLEEHKNHTLSENQRIASETQNQLLVVFSASLAIIIIATILITRSIVRPVYLFTRIVKEIAGGRLDVKVAMKSHDEIGELAQSFNSMIDELNESRKKIEQHQQELEKSIGQRTSDLNEKMSEIEKSRTAILNMMEDAEETNKQLFKTQEELKKALEELKKTDVKKDEFISVTAHEFKTPLTAIHGFAELLQDKKIDMKSTKKYLTIIREETERLAKLVTEILNLSRIDLGTLKLTYENIDLYSLVETIRSEADIKIKARGLKSGYELEKRLPRIESDREKLTEILLNLLDNAAKYTNKGAITTKIFREGDGVHFTVKDTGIGIPKEAQSKMFERFYQVDSSNTRKVGGTGLGLALSREYVVTMGGKMWFASEAGKGSEFHFTLPIKAPKKDQAAEKYEGKTKLFRK
jgi:signal transduction histidine kinase